MKIVQEKFASKALVLSTALVCGSVVAVPINLTAQLTGDARQASGLNPGNLVVDVTITGDTNSNTATFLVELDNTNHPDIKLDEFYFNVEGDAADYSFANFDPADWGFSTPASVQGAGGTTFMFEVLDPQGAPNADDVTGTQPLSFDLILNTGNFTESIFLNAPISISNDAGQGQLGAHLQSLTENLTNCPNGCQTDSGFAFGGYSSGTISTTSTSGGTTSSGVPAPGALSLLGAGLVSGLFFARGRSKKKSQD